MTVDFLEELNDYKRKPENGHSVILFGIVFWTKNPVPMLSRMDELEAYNYYFQFTLTAYGPEVERVIWRYDPIFLNETYTVDYHCKYFEVLASKLSPYTEKCTISFLDFYKSTERNVKPLCIQPILLEQQAEIVGKLAEIAHKYHLSLDTCAEAGDFRKFGVTHACCIDRERFERI